MLFSLLDWISPQNIARLVEKWYCKKMAWGCCCGRLLCLLVAEAAGAQILTWVIHPFLMSRRGEPKEKKNIPQLMAHHYIALHFLGWTISTGSTTQQKKPTQEIFTLLWAWVLTGSKDCQKHSENTKAQGLFPSCISLAQPSSFSQADRQQSCVLYKHRMEETLLM